MSVRSMRRIITSLGLSAVRWNQKLGAGSGSMGDFRSESPRNRSVILLWAAGCSADDPKVHETITSFSEHAQVVLVIDDLAFQSASVLGCFVEALPSASDRGKLTSLDWSHYVSNRIARIRETWNPDLIVNLGEPVDTFLERFGSSVEPVQSLQTIEDIERQMRPG